MKNKNTKNTLRAWDRIATGKKKTRAHTLTRSPYPKEKELGNDLRLFALEIKGRAGSPRQSPRRGCDENHSRKYVRLKRAHRQCTHVFLCVSIPLRMRGFYYLFFSASVRIISLFRVSIDTVTCERAKYNKYYLLQNRVILCL